MVSSVQLQQNFFILGGGAESKPVEVSSGLVGGGGPQRDVAASCDGVTQAAQPSTPLSSALCRPLQLYGPATRISCSSCASFPQTSSPLPPARCLPPYFPCFPGLICHCGLIISACSCSSSGRLTFLSGSAVLFWRFHVVSFSSGTRKVCQRKAAAAVKLLSGGMSAI